MRSPLPPTRTVTALVAATGLALPVLLACGRDDSVRRGRMFIEAGMYAEAVPLLRLAIEAKPNDAEGHLLLGTALLGVGERSAAEEAFGRTTLLDPRRESEIGEAYYRVASALLQNSDFSSAREGYELLRMAIAKQPKHTTEAASLLAERGFAELNDPGLAHQLLSGAQELDPKIAEDENVRLAIAVAMPETQHKRQKLETFVSDFPKSEYLPRALLALARCCHDQDDYEGAIARLEYLMAHFPNSIEADLAKHTLTQVRSDRDELRRLEANRVASLASDEQTWKGAGGMGALERARLRAQEEQAREDAERRKRQEAAEHKAWIERLGGSFMVRAFNIDDVATVTVNGAMVIETRMGQDSGWVTIDEHLRPAWQNDITFTVDDHGGGWTFGFQLKQADTMLWEDQCGQLGIEGCTRNSGSKDYAFRYTHTLSMR